MDVKNVLDRKMMEKYPAENTSERPNKYTRIDLIHVAMCFI